MNYVNFGSAGVKVSRMALGLGLRGQADEREAERMVGLALDRGVNLLDCANVYGMMDDRRNIGKSEELLGRVLGSRRDDLVITSKVTSPIGPGPNDWSASRYHIAREVERSLRRLNTDRIDVYLLHAMDETTPDEEKFRALDSLVAQGKIRYVGVCNYQAWQVVQALRVQDRLNAAPLITVQNPYSLLNRSLEREMFPMARSTGLGVMAYSPLGVGLLSGRYAPDALPEESSLWGSRRRTIFRDVLRGRAADVLAAVQGVAARLGATVAQVAQAWVLAQPEITVIISGADTAQQLDENLGALELTIPAEEMALLNQVSAGLSMVLDGSDFEPGR
ncbi:MAG: aldo/keto reductase [Chloroflexi bacterium]|nr:aldo/keto reductase [Chloroflexota bacterium]